MTAEEAVVVKAAQFNGGSDGSKVAAAELVAVGEWQS